MKSSFEEMLIEGLSPDFVEHAKTGVIPSGALLREVSGTWTSYSMGTTSVGWNRTPKQNPVGHNWHGPGKGDAVPQ